MRTESPGQPKSSIETVAQPAGSSKKTAAQLGWEEFLLGKKTKAAPFLTKLRKGSVPILDGATRERLAAEAASMKDGFARLLDLAQASVGSIPSIRETSLDLAVASLEHAGIDLTSTSSNPYAYSHRIETWLERMKRPLKNEQLRILLLLLHVGVARYELDRVAAFDVLAKALAPPKAKQNKRRSSAAPPPRAPHEVLILADPAQAVLTTLLKYEVSVSGETKRLETQVQTQAAEITQLRNQISEISATLQEARNEIQGLRQETESAASEITGLKTEIVDIHGDYKYKLYELRGRVRGVLGGQLTQWLQTALDASYASPPRAGAIQERLEDALSMIQKEMQWLQHSD